MRQGMGDHLEMNMAQKEIIVNLFVAKTHKCKYIHN